MPLAHHETAIASLLDLLAKDSSKWMSVMRCRLCGSLWAEDFLTSGHADISFVYPVEADDAERWLADARPLF
jgi:hypothetical protein